MDEPDKLIELRPKEWKSDRERPHEPILGRGAGYFFGELAFIAATLALLLVVIWFGVSAKRSIYGLLFGEPKQTNLNEPVPPGNYIWTPSGGLQRRD